MLDVLIVLAKVLGAQLFVVAVVVPVIIWAERRLVALIQQRIGPNRCGPFGLLQPLADFGKLLMKETITPAGADAKLYAHAPRLTAVPAFLGMIVIPYSMGEHGHAARLPISALLVLALGGIQVYGVFLAGWASGNKYSLMGAIRASAQMISYELTLGACVLIVGMMCGSLDLVEIVERQRGGIANWNVLAYFPLGVLPFVLMVIAMVAESNRAPFDLPEAESELVAGFHTEYSSTRFAAFFMAEYAAMWNISALVVTLYLGGWTGPFIESLASAGRSWLAFLLGIVYFVLKTGCFMVLYVWIRGTLPRLRYDQLMNLGWKGLLPAAFVCFLAIGAAMTFLG